MTLDVRGQVTGMSRLADVLFVGFAVCPDWNHHKELDPAQIDIEVVLSRQLQQNSEIQQIIKRLENIVRSDLALPHVHSFSLHSATATSNSGHILDETNRHRLTNPIRLARSVTHPASPLTQQHAALVSTQGRNVGEQSVAGPRELPGKSHCLLNLIH